MLRRRRKENKRDKDDGDKDIILSLGLADKPPPLSHPPPIVPQKGRPLNCNFQDLSVNNKCHIICK